MSTRVKTLDLIVYVPCCHIAYILFDIYLKSTITRAGDVHRLLRIEAVCGYVCVGVCLCRLARLSEAGAPSPRSRLAVEAVLECPVCHRVC